MRGNRVRLGVIGCGKFPIGAQFPCFHLASIELVAVCDLDRECGEHAAGTFCPARGYTDHRAILAAESMDSVIRTPNLTAISPENWSLAHMGYLGEVRKFAECVLAGRAPKPDMADAAAAVRLVHAIHDSNGQPIVLRGGGA